MTLEELQDVLREPVYGDFVADRETYGFASVIPSTTCARWCNGGRV